MPGIKTDLRNIGQAFKQFKAIEAQEVRKTAMINEYTQEFMRQGKSVWLARELAEEKYRQIHRNGNT